MGQAAAIPKHYLYAGILIFATVGAYGMRQSATFDLVLLYAIGVVGVVMRRFDIPTWWRRWWWA